MQSLQHFLGLIAVTLGLLAAVLFMAMVVVGQVVVMVRWIRRLQEIPNSKGGDA